MSVTEQRLQFINESERQGETDNMASADSAQPCGGVTPPRADAVIELRKVSKVYGKTTVIEDLNLCIRRGEFLTLLGPSGCGKTTTLKMIAGFEPPTHGQIMLEGQDVSGIPPYGRNLNTVFQQYALFPHMNVFENVAFGPRTRRLKSAEVNDRVETMLNMVHMIEHAKQKPNQLSGGQQQRIALARALVNYPSALLLDEPLSALDVKLRRAMQLELKKIQAEVKTTFIFVTHDQEEALTMSSRIAVMNAGHIEQLGTPEEIYYRPRTPFVASFIGQANLLPCRVLDAGRDAATVAIDGGGKARVPRAANGPRVEKDALLMLRPEQLLLRSRNEGDEDRHNHLCGHLREIDFHGAMTRYVIETGSGRELTIVLSPRDKPEGLFSENQPVTVCWDKTHAWLIDTQER